MPSFRGRPPYHMSEMIAAEPSLAERLIHRLSGDELVEQLAAAIREAASAGHPVLTTGCGTSEHAAMGIAALLNEALDLGTGREVRSIQALIPCLSRKARISSRLRPSLLDVRIRASKSTGYQPRRRASQKPATFSGSIAAATRRS